MTALQLERWIKQRGITKQEASRLIGVTPITLSRWLHGVRPIPHWLTAVLAQLDAKQTLP